MSDAAARATLLRAAIDLEGPASPTRETLGRWERLAMAERIVPLLWQVVDKAGQHLDAAEFERVESLAVDVAALSVRLERSLLRVAGVLEAADVPFVVLKGIATAHLDHPQPNRRQFGDVDLLLAPPDLGRARSALEADGWHQAYALPRHHERFTHAVTFGGVGIAEIDVHQRVGHRALGLRIPTDELLADRIPFEIAGHPLWALSDVDRLIHACIHAVASRGQYRRLSSVADVLVISRRRPELAAHALERAERWGVRPLVEAGVRLAHDEARLDVPDRWTPAMATPLRRRDRLVERAYLGDTRRPVTEEVAHLRSMAGWRDRFVYLYGHLRMDAGPGAGGLRSRLHYLRSRLRDRS